MASDTNFLNQKEIGIRYVKSAGIVSLAGALVLLFFISHASFDRDKMKIEGKDASAYHGCLFSRPVDLNSVVIHELAELPGIGEKGAEKIVGYRQRLGFFLCMEELYGPESPLNLRQMRTLFMYATIR